MILPITLTMAGAATLLNMWLAYRVGQMRRAHRVSIGDGGALPLVARMRAQANFVEYTPFFLILLGLVELASGPAVWLWAIGAVYILARLLHAFGMDGAPVNKLRMIGTATTGLLLGGLAIYALVLPYLDRPRPATPVSQIRAA
jgi:uncharacterized membrane protein YecN with MAPEG domain